MQTTWLQTCFDFSVCICLRCELFFSFIWKMATFAYSLWLNASEKQLRKKRIHFCFSHSFSETQLIVFYVIFYAFHSDKIQKIVFITHLSSIVQYPVERCWDGNIAYGKHEMPLTEPVVISHEQKNAINKYS